MLILSFICDILFVHVRVSICSYWELKKEMAAGSEPEYICGILQALRPLCEGLSLCGAGAGGYAVVVLKRDVTCASLARTIYTINQEFKNAAATATALGGGNEEQGSSVGDCLSLHSVDIDMKGIQSHLVSSVVEENLKVELVDALMNLL